MGHDLIFLGVYFEERGVRVKSGKFFGEVRLLLAMGLDLVFKFGLAGRLFGETLMVSLSIRLQALGTFGRARQPA